MQIQLRLARQHWMVITSIAGFVFAVLLSELFSSHSGAPITLVFAALLGPPSFYLITGFATGKAHQAVMALVLGMGAFLVFVVYLTIGVVGSID